MDYQKCTQCGRYGFTDRHRCDPVWEVRIVEDDDHYPGHNETKEIYAGSPTSAAEEWASWWESSDVDYAIMDGAEVMVIVYPRGNPHAADVFSVEQLQEWAKSHYGHSLGDPV